jgi:DNA-binding NtrC family response regulator
LVDEFKGMEAVQSRKVLVADDEFLIRWSLTQVLSREGFDVISVENGMKAIEAVRAQHFDFVITDLVMPELGGWEVLETARQIHPSPRVIVITAHGSEATQRIAKERGAWAYVEKPYIIDQIKKVLGEVLKEGTGLNLH